MTVHHFYQTGQDNLVIPETCLEEIPQSNSDSSFQQDNTYPEFVISPNVRSFTKVVDFPNAFEDNTRVSDVIPIKLIVTDSNDDTNTTCSYVFNFNGPLMKNPSSKQMNEDRHIHKCNMQLHFQTP